MFIVQINKNNILDELVLVTTDLKKAQQHFLDTCSDHLSNWDKYTQADKDALLDLGYEQTGDGAIVLIDTDGITSDDAIRDELARQGDVTTPEIEALVKEIGSTKRLVSKSYETTRDASAILHFCDEGKMGELLQRTMDTISLLSAKKEVIAENKHE